MYNECSFHAVATLWGLQRVRHACAPCVCLPRIAIARIDNIPQIRFEFSAIGLVRQHGKRACRRRPLIVTDRGLLAAAGIDTAPETALDTLLDTPLDALPHTALCTAEGLHENPPLARRPLSG